MNECSRSALSRPDFQFAMLETKNLKLVPHTPEALRALIAGHEPYAQLTTYALAEGVREFFVSGVSEASSDYSARLQTATEADPWTHGFAVVLGSAMIGSCGYKGPPGPEAMVEIGYGIAPAFCGKGYATEAAEALTRHAFETGKVTTVRAHTLPERNASAKVLDKCGFTLIGEVIDPEDGRVWRWEKRLPS